LHEYFTGSSNFLLDDLLMEESAVKKSVIGYSKQHKD
jgi:hypothetical protein